MFCRPLDDLGNDYIGAQEDSVLANGIMNFSPTKVGHQFLEETLSTLKFSYEASAWSANGPQLITNQLRKFCKLDPVSMRNIHSIYIFINYIYFKSLIEVDVLTIPNITCSFTDIKHGYNLRRYFLVCPWDSEIFFIFLVMQYHHNMQTSNIDLY